MPEAPLQNGGAKDGLRGTPDLDQLEHCFNMAAVSTRLQMAVTGQMTHVLCLKLPNQLLAGIWSNACNVTAMVCSTYLPNSR